MKFDNEIEGFINDYVKDLNEGTASVFAGAGLSVPAGYVNWKDLMEEIAHDLGLDIEIENDLVSIAQYHLNENLNRNKLNRKILEEFIEDAVPTDNHKILANLPISSIWTTNYDELIEKTFEEENKVVDVKYTNEQLLTTRPKRDLVVYKMHGDVNHPNNAIITKEQYEKYHYTHEPYINALSGELTMKTFLFIGFSFTDPNLDYVLSRLNLRFGEHKRQHYAFIKKPALGDKQSPDKATLEYNLKKQSFMINDLKRYGIKSLKIDSYDEITEILKEIELRYKKRTIFISGSAEIYKPFDKQEAIGFVHKLSKKLIETDYTIVNGFGWGVGSFVINGALEAIYSNPTKYSESQLVLKPFPQFKSGKRELPELWKEYREKMISKSGITLFMFGNKKKNDNIVPADGILKEFAISKKLGNICIPIGITGHVSKDIYDAILKEPKEYYENPELIIPILEKLADPTKSLDQVIQILIKFLKSIKK